MGYGQYSAGGGENRTKAEMIRIFEAQGYSIDPSQARKGGKNRLHFVDCGTGDEHFTLHETVVATLSKSRDRLTMADGGWHTPTTKTAWSQAIQAFKLEPTADHFERDDWWERAGHGADKWPGERDAEGFAGYLRKGYVKIGQPSRDERSVTFRTTDTVGVWERDADVLPDHPMLRADTDCGNFAVRYDGRELISGADHRVKISPYALLKVLYRIDGLVRAVGSRHAIRGYAIEGIYFDALGYHIQCGQSARQVMVGCHTFRTMDVRSFKRAIEALYPTVVKPAKRIVRKNPLDYHVPEFEAAARAQLAEYRRRAALRISAHAD